MTEKNTDSVPAIVKNGNINADGWTNLFTNLASGKDRTSNTSHGLGALLNQTSLEQLYRFTGFAKKVIDIPANEMTRQWIDIENDPENHGLQALEKIGAKTCLRDLLRWGNLYGGAIAVIGIEDGNMLDMAVNERNIRKIEWLRVYDRYQITWFTEDVCQDAESKYFGLPEYYVVQAYNTATIFRVHASRVLRFDGAEVPDRVRVQNQGWGDSFLQAVYDELRNYGIVNQSVVSIVEDFVQTILNIENLSDMVAAGDENLIKTRLDLIDMSRSVNNTIMLDGDEKFAKQASSVTGLDKLMAQFALALSGVTGIPVTKLFGQAPAGLNATGDSDIRNFYDDIKSKQEDTLLPMLKVLHRYIMLSKEMGYGGKINPDAKIDFNPLWQLTDEQDATRKKTIAETDKIYIETGVLAPEEVAESRFDGGFSPDTTLDTQNRENPPSFDEPKENE